MRISSLHIANFRNYSRLDISFGPDINLIMGANAQGKSNLLEAVSYLGLASSFRGARDPELIRQGEDYFYLRGETESRLRGELKIEAAADRARRRRWKLNGEPKVKLAQVVGLFHTVVFAPEDIWLVKAGPEYRRRYLNRQLSQNDPAYCQGQLLYNHILRQRNACLRAAEPGREPEQLVIWDAQLAQAGAAIIASRLKALERLAPLANTALERLAPGEEVGLRYMSSLTKAGPAEVDELEGRFLAELQRLRQSELYRGATLTGPHRDDMAITLDGRPARDFASQGQQRTLALVLKLAELELAREQRGEYPALLLDDVFSELDADRRQHILSLVDGAAQTFITSVDPVDMPGAARFVVRAGAVEGQ